MNILNLNPYTQNTQRFAGMQNKIKDSQSIPDVRQQTAEKSPLLNGAYFGVKPVQFGARNPNYVGTPLLINPEFTTQYEEASARPYSWGNSLFESHFNTTLAQFQNTISNAEKPSHKKLSQLQQILIKNGIVKISGPVTDQMAEMVQERVNILEGIMKKTGKVQPINFLINSPGGSILAMNSIIDSMDQVKATKIDGKNIPIATYVQGYAASAASVITANGTPGHRSMSKKAEIMIHQPLGGASGQATDIEIRYKQIMRYKRQINEFFAKVTKVPQEEIDIIMERDYWMESAESLEKGFVDKVVDQLPGLNISDEEKEAFIGENQKKAPTKSKSEKTA